MRHRRHPVHAAQAALIAIVLAFACGGAAAPAGLDPQWKAAGAARLSHWGFAVYDARLWVEPAFSRAAYERHAFALELTYLRGLRGEAVADRSVEELRQLQAIPPGAEARWREQLRGLFPDVGPGDRITGIHRPGRPAVFLLNGGRLGEIADTQLASRFFGIWLSPRTSQPALRASLLEGTP
jgi:hypothetical protein